jgi:hypothetical protein
MGTVSELKPLECKLRRRPTLFVGPPPEGLKTGIGYLPTYANKYPIPTSLLPRRLHRNKSKKSDEIIVTTSKAKSVARYIQE